MRLQHVSIAIPLTGRSGRAVLRRPVRARERDVLPKLDPAGFIWFRAGGGAELHLMLVDEPPPERPHFCLAVDDLEALRARIEGAGVETRDGTELIGRPRFTCRDPFGNLVELTRIAG